MIVKILSKSSSFGAVQYNTRKINSGDGELMCFENFPFERDILPTPEKIKNYLKAVSNTNKRIQNAQFHATISAKGKEYSSKQLTDIGRQFLQKMGYDKQPFIIVAHNDTDNNHIHIVSTRVRIDGKKINHNFEKLRSQKYLQEIMEKDYGVDEHKRLNNLLKYKISSVSQFKTLLEVNHLQLTEKEGKYNIYKAGVFIDNVELTLNKERNLNRTKQLQGIFKSYYQTYNHTLKEDKRGVLGSEMTEKLKSNLGVDIVFHVSKNNNKPFGYTIIDNTNKSVYKGSEIFDLKYLLNKPQIKEVQALEIYGETSFSSQQIENTKSGDILKSVLNILNSGGGEHNQNENEQKENNKKRKRR